MNSYLNQTGHFIIEPSWKYSSFINCPYQFIRSMIDAVKEQREEAYRQHRQILDIALTFVFSKYAVICLLTTLALNEFIISRSPLYNARLRSSRRKQLIKLSSSTQHLIQIGNICILIYALCLPFFKKDLLTYLFRRYMAFVIGYAFSTTISIVNHRIPLESSDYSLFELTVQYYLLEKRLLNTSIPLKEQETKFKWIFIPDCSVALTNLLIIHAVEFFNIRKYRLFITCFIEFINMSYFATLCLLQGLDNIPFIIQYRNFPKIFYTVVTLLSLFCFSLAVLVRWDPRNHEAFRFSDLQYYSFMKNWWNQLNLTGEEDFSLAVRKYVQLIYSRKNTELLHYHRELPPIVIRKTDNLVPDNITISLKTKLNDETNSNVFSRRDNGNIDNTKDYTHDNFNKCHFFTVPFYWDICKMTWRYFMSRFSNKQENEKLIPNLLKRSNDVNMEFNTDLLDDNNQLWVSLNNESTTYVEEDDEDYILEEILSDQEDEISEYDNDDELQNEIDVLDLILTSNENVMKKVKHEELTEQDWFRQMIPVIGVHLMEDKRITRSQYINTRNNYIFKVEGFTNINLPMQHKGTLDSLCAVCKTNERCIILWPCRCFALCENCRSSLALRGYEKCVYCRQPVSGYSKVELQ